MFYVYVLSNPDGRFYIGQTNDLKRRLREHRSGKVYTTNRIKGPWELFYYEASTHQADAFRRERFLKSGPGYRYLYKRLKYSLSK